MKAIKFKESNVVYAENQPEYFPIPVFKDESGTIVECWKLSFVERIRLLFTGKLWISMMTFNKPLMPHLPTTVKSDVLTTTK